MRIPVWILTLISLAALAGCSSYSITRDYDSSAAFNTYKTYRWSTDSTAKTENLTAVKNPLLFKRIKSAVDRELSAKGFTSKEDGRVDFLVSVHKGILERVVIEPPPPTGFSWHHGYYSDRFGLYYNYWGWPYGPYTRVGYYDEGTLAVAIIDGKSNDLVWHGMARGFVKDYDSGIDMQRDIDEAIKQILAKFPPSDK